MYKFELGQTVKDVLSGFEGLITGRADYLTGCNQYSVSPPLKDGAWVDGRWFDESRLKLINKKKVTLVPENEEKPGCDITPPRAK
jgi:hypothetical protein